MFSVSVWTQGKRQMIRYHAAKHNYANGEGATTETVPPPGLRMSVVWEGKALTVLSSLCGRPARYVESCTDNAAVNRSCTLSRTRHLSTAASNCVVALTRGVLWSNAGIKGESGLFQTLSWGGPHFFSDPSTPRTHKESEPPPDPQDQ